MKNHKFFLGWQLRLPVLWLGAGMASGYEDGMTLFDALGAFSEWVNHPVITRWTPYTLKFMGIALMLYLFAVVLYLSSRENRRPGEEHGRNMKRLGATRCSVPSDTEYYLLRKAMRLFAEHGEKTDDETIAAIAAAIRREPKTALEIIRSGTQNMYVLPLDYSTDDEEDEPMEIGSTSDEPSALFFQAYQMDALYDAFRGLDYREREMLGRHYGFCPECFSVVDKDGRPRPKETYEDIMLDFGLSSPDTVEKTCKRALKKIRKAIQ